MRYLAPMVLTLLLAGCQPQALNTPEVSVHPESAGLGSDFSIHLYGAQIADYRFMGAREGPDGLWTVRLDPSFLLGLFFNPAEFTVRKGDMVPMGPDPSVLIEIVEVEATRIKLRAVEPYKATSGH
ncbi:MAG TPA: hypothetical protein VD902_10290 [Symbiobacteriaceae bacterium]|nr:hypothetical protein [Symbiobacteriaceae bacterium]